MNDQRNDRRDVELARYFAFARQVPPDISGVERNFETRVMARIRELREPWYALSWRLAPAFLGLTLLVAGWSMFYTPAHSSDPVATLASGPQEVALIDYLTGE
jgi:hypothetical protein